MDEHWITSEEAARILHCSASLVRWFHKHGRLHARKDDRGVYSFARSEVAALARTRAARGTPSRRGDREVLRETVNGQSAAEAFRLFRIGAGIDEVVIKTQLPPERVRDLYLEYVTPIGLPSPVAAERERARQDAAALARDERGSPAIRLQRKVPR